MMKMDTLGPDLHRSIEIMDRLLHTDINGDIKRRSFVVLGRRAVCYILDGMVSSEFWQRYILEPCFHADGINGSWPIADALEQILPVGEITRICDGPQAARLLMNGQAVLLCDGMPCSLCLDIRSFVRRGIAPPLMESVINGPHQGFNESLRDNLTLIRRYLPTPDLIDEIQSIGKRYPTNMAVVYLAGIADEDSLSALRKRLDDITADHILSIGMLEQLIEDRPYSLIPQFCLTERPDRAVSFLLEGQILLVLDGSPQVMCLPISLLHLMHTPDDSSMRWQTGTFLRLIRFLGAGCTLFLPALFVALVTFHPQVLPVTLLTAILESQASIPLSITAECFLMILMFNLMIEACVRIPSVVGATIGTVSGLILGQTAVEAKLVHPFLIVVVAIASLGSFVVPDYALSVTFRIGQLLFLMAASIFGLYGMVLLFIVGLVHLCGLKSLGSPFMAPASPFRDHNPDLLIRYPVWQQRWRTWLANPEHRRRFLYISSKEKDGHGRA